MTAEDLLISKFMTAITDKKLQDNLMKEKKPEKKQSKWMYTKNKTKYRKNKSWTAKTI